MLTFDESGGRSLLAYLLCGGQAVVMETTVINTLTSTDWSEGFVGELNFGILGEAVVFTANVLNLLIIGGFHACRKRERKTDYRRRYQVSRSRDSFFRCEAILGPELPTG